MHRCCTHKDSEWIFTGLCDERDGEGYIVLDHERDIVLDHNKEKDESVNLFDHYQYCSKFCFKKYFNEEPTLGKIFHDWN